MTSIASVPSSAVGDQKPKLEGLNDHILSQFSIAQKEYIVEKLYPSIEKALVHFISEAMRHNEIVERKEELIRIESIKSEQTPKNQTK